MTPLAPMTAADRLKGALSRLVGSMVPTAPFLGLYEYRVASQSGPRIDARPTNPDLGLPDLRDIIMRPSLTGDQSDLPDGSGVIVAFINGDPARPEVVFADPGNPPNAVRVKAGTVSFQGGTYNPTEHLATAEGVVGMFINFLFMLQKVGDPSKFTDAGKIMDPAEMTPGTTLRTQLEAWLTDCTNPLVPPVTNTATGGGILDPLLYPSIEAAVAGKIPNITGLIPGIGAPNVETG